MTAEIDIKKKILFIVNPFSGVWKRRSIDQHLKRHLDHTKYEYEVKYTEAPNHAKILSRQAVKENMDIIVAVGGDGTVNEVAQSIIGTSVVMGIIPSGSGNGLARHLNIPVFTNRAIAVINQLKVKKIDTAEVNNQFFVNLAGIGFDALVAKKFAGQKRRGFFKYSQIVFQEYFRYRPEKFKLVVDGKKLKRKALFISFANSDQFGYNTSIAPQARVDDGYIDICIMKKVALWKSFLLPPLLFSKKIDKTGFVEIIRAKEVDIKQKKKHINLDGEPVKLSKRLHIRVIPKSLNMVVPG